MEGDQISVIVVVSRFHMFVKGILCVKTLFLQQCRFVLHTNITQVAVVLFLQVAFEETDGVELGIVLAILEPAAHSV